MSAAEHDENDDEFGERVELAGEGVVALGRRCRMSVVLCCGDIMGTYSGDPEREANGAIRGDEFEYYEVNRQKTDLERARTEQ